MLPKGYLIGYLTAKPIHNTSSNGKIYSKFSVGCSSDYYSKNNDSNGDNSVFFNCICWSKTAVFANDFLNKGDKVVLDFVLTINSYKNAENKIIKNTELIVTNINILNKKNDNFSKNILNNDELKENDEKSIDEISTEDISLEEIFSKI